MSTLVSTHWATHVTTIHTAKSPTVGSQVLQFSGLCQLLFIVHFLEDSIETPGTAQWHFRLPHHGFGPEPFFGLRETSLSAWFKIIQNISKYVSTCLNNLQKQYCFFILLCPLADVSSGLTSDGKSADRDNSCRTKQDVPQKTSTANTCIQHTVAFLSCPCEDAWPCLAMFCLRSGGFWWTLHLPSMFFNSSWPQLTQATSPSVLRFWLSYEDFRPVIRVGLSQINLDPAHWSPIWEILCSPQ